MALMIEFSPKWLYTSGNNNFHLIPQGQDSSDIKKLTRTKVTSGKNGSYPKTMVYSLMVP